MRTKERKQGISLIVLIVTIIVIIILAGVVILTLSKNNPIESAKEARFKEDIRTFQDELSLAVSKEYANAGGHRDIKITTSNFDEIKQYIPSFSEKYRDKFVIQDDELKYTKKLDEKEKEYALSLNINKKKSIIPNVYQQVEYIESTGTQYIDTGYTFSKGNEFIFKCQWFESKNFTYSSTMFGANSSDKEVLLAYEPQYTNYLGGNFSYDWKLKTDYEIDLDLANSTENLVLKVNNITIRNITGNVNQKKCYLFGGIGSAGTETISYKASERFYYFSIYNGINNLVCNLIPCYSTTTVTDVKGNVCPIGTIGMYDTVEGKFYTNQGTGEFVTGPEV